MNVDGLLLIDHHCHGVVKKNLDRPSFENLISESFDPPPAGTSGFDSPLGLAIRSRCAPVLGLEPFASPEDYMARRGELGAEEVGRRFLDEAHLQTLLIDTGYRSEELHDIAGMAELARIPVRQVVRLEAMAEAIAAKGVEAGAYATAFADSLGEAARNAVGFKSVVAYRGGFAFDPEQPSAGDVTRAAAAFLRTAEDGPAKLEDPVLIRFGIWTAAEVSRASDRRMPIQFHSGWGDPDLDLHLTNPTLLTELVRKLSAIGVDVAFLHCYPFHRDAGYLAAMYPNVYYDVGSALHYMGPSSSRLLAEAMEVAPFGKLLYSSDAFGVAEQYYLSALLFRRALEKTLEVWIAEGHCNAAEARRIAEGFARGNAERIYPLNG